MGRRSSLACAVLVLAAACSDFTPAEAPAPGEDAGVVVPGDAGPVATTCDPAAAFDEPTPMADLAGDGTGSTLRLSSDGLFGYLSIRQADPTTTGAGAERDIVIAARPTTTDPFGSLAVVAALRSTASDDSPTVTGDGLTAYFASTRPGSVGSFDIWFATRASAGVEFGAPALVDGVNSGESDASPFVREDGNVLYFSRTKGLQNHDLWRAERTVNGFVAKVVSELSEGDEQHAVVTPDDLVMYYASTSPDGQPANLDVWVSTRAGARDAFGTPRRVAELGTPGDDIPTFLTADRCTLYLTRRTLDGLGFETSRSLLVARRRPR